MIIKTIEQRINNQIIVDTLYDDGMGNDGQIRRCLNENFETEAIYILINGDVMRKATGNVSYKKAHNTMMRLLKKAK